MISDADARCGGWVLCTRHRDAAGKPHSERQASRHRQLQRSGTPAQHVFRPHHASRQDPSEVLFQEGKSCCVMSCHANLHLGLCWTEVAGPIMSPKG